MENNIIKLYEALEEADFEKFDEVYDGVKEGRILLEPKDIVLLCSIFTHKWEYMEPHQIRKIVKMTFMTMYKYELECGLEELVNGLELIYRKSLVDNERNNGFTYEDFIIEFLGMFVNSFKEEDMILLSRILSENKSSDFKMKVTGILKKDIKECDDKDYKIKGNILVSNIKV